MGGASKARAAVIGVGAVVGLPVALWALSMGSVSPEQRVADAEPPPEPVVEVEVEERRLEDNVVFRGVVSAVRTQEVTAPEVVEGGPVVVELPVSPGDLLEAGDLVAVIADRPVIVVGMPVPLHRALDPGAEGPDVQRFQEALSALGHEVGDDAPGTFGPGTQAAVAALYGDVGFAPPTTGPEADEALSAAEAQRRSASEAVEDADAALAQQEAALARQRDALDQARRARDDASAAADDAAADAADAPAEQAQAAQAAEDAAEAELASAEAAVDAARESVASAEDSVAGAERALERARRALAEAEEAVGEADAAVGVRAPASELLGVAALPAVVSSVDAAVGETAADGPLLSFTPSALVIEAAVDASLAPLLAPGTRGEAGDGWPVEVVANHERGEDGRPRVTLATDEPLGPDELGRDVRVEARLAATDGPVLAVPVTAIRSDADGDYVRVVDADGATRRVGVRSGGSVGGWVELTGADEELAPGTVVRAG